jgi:two-component system OmpR family response regulator
MMADRASTVADIQQPHGFRCQYGVMTAPRILVVDDEPNIRDLLVTSLRFAGYQVRAVATARRRSRPCSKRNRTSSSSTSCSRHERLQRHQAPARRGYTAPILFLTAKDETEDKIEG